MDLHLGASFSFGSNIGSQKESEEPKTTAIKIYYKELDSLQTLVSRTVIP